MKDPVFSRVIKEIKDYAIFTMDREGYVMSWNEGAKRIKGYGAEEITGKYFGLLFPEDAPEDKPKKELEEASRNGRFEEEGWRKRKNGALFWAHIILTAIHNEEGQVVGFVKVTQDLTEKKKFEEALFRKNERLIKANADLDNFVYTASHDLKSPVNNIEGLLNYITPELEPKKMAQMLEYLKTSVEKLKSTITDLSNIALLQKDIEDGSQDDIYIEEIFEDVKYSLTNQMRDDCPNVETDFQVKKIKFSRLNLKSILYNLISNSIKYKSPERDCRVKLSSFRENDHLILEVSDNGIGMPAGYQQKIFKMFSRMHKHVDGSGIGLYILKRIVDNSGGTIDIQSEEGKGTTFRISLPNVISPENS